MVHPFLWGIITAINLAVLPNLALALGKSKPVHEIQLEPNLTHSYGSLEENYNARVETMSEIHNHSQSSASCRVSQVQIKGTDPVTLQDRIIDIKVFSPRNEPAKSGSVIVVPPIYGDTLFDSWNARRFCDAGLQTAVIQKWEFYSDPGIDWNVHDRGALRAVTAIRHVLEYLLAAKPGPVGILGTSLGAISSSLALSIEPRLTAAVLIGGGGPLHQILTKSSIKVSQMLKKQRMKLYSLNSDEQYEDQLSESIQFDTLKYADLAPPKNIWMFIATADTTVPASTQWQLWQAWKKPKLTQGRLDHTGMIIYSFAFWSHSIRNYFLEQLIR
jgi:dienelactone hydrolase